MAAGVFIPGVTDTDIKFMITGCIPNACLAHGFGHPEKPEAFFDPTVYGEVKLKVTNAQVTGDGAVFIQQLRR